MSVIKVTDDHSAVSALRRILEFESDLDYEIEYENFGQIVLRFQGPQFNQSLTTTVMTGLLELQRELHRAYCLSVHGTPNLRRLSREEREALELVVVVEQGSSKFKINLVKTLTNSKLAKLWGKKMSGKEIVATILGLAIVFTSGYVYRQTATDRKEIRLREIDSEQHRQTLDQVNELRQHEIETLKIFAELTKHDDKLAAYESFARDAQIGLLKAGGSATKVEIQDLELDGEVAHDLVKNARRQSYDVTLKDVFTILKVDATKPDRFLVAILREGENEPISAIVPDTDLNLPLKKIIQAAEWGRLPLQLKVKTRMVGDEITKAEIVDAKRAETDEIAE